MSWTAKDKARRAERQAAGRCIDCGEPTRYRRCLKHRLQGDQAHRRWLAKRTAA